MTEVTPYHVPKEPGRWRALLLAAAVHGGLLGILWFGVRWNNEMPIAIEAEIWSPQMREAAPRPQPERAPEPQPEIKQPPKPDPVETPIAKPDIALEQEKKRKEKEQKLRDEAELQARQRAEKERLAKEQADKEKAEVQTQKLREEQVKKAEAEKKRREQQLENQRMAKLREEEMRRITGGVAGTGGNGDATQTQGARGNADYANRVGAKIKSNTIFNVPDYLTGNPVVEYAVELLPDGSIRGPVRKLKSSGLPGFDEAVLNAIEKSQPFPPDKSGKVPSSFNIVHRPKDQ